MWKIAILTILAGCVAGSIDDPAVASLSVPLVVSCPIGDELARKKLTDVFGCDWIDDSHAANCGGDYLPVQLLPAFVDDGLLAGNYFVESTYTVKNKQRKRVFATLDCPCSVYYECTMLYQ